MDKAIPQALDRVSSLFYGRWRGEPLFLLTGFVVTLVLSGRARISNQIPADMLLEDISVQPRIAMKK